MKEEIMPKMYFRPAWLSGNVCSLFISHNQKRLNGKNTALKFKELAVLQLP